ARSVQIVSRLGEQRRHVARGALTFDTEDLLPACGGDFVKGTRRWLRGRNGELIKVKSGELGGNDIRLAPRISGTPLRGDWILLLVVQPGVEEGSRAVHLGRGDIGVPVGHGSEAGPGVEVDAGEAESRRNDGAGLLPIGPEALAVLVELGVEATR